MDQNPDTQPDSPSPDSSLQGKEASLADDQQRAEAIDQAFDYRGDVTVETSDGRRIDGYIFDRDANSKEPYIRILPSDGSQRQTIPYTQISSLSFSGKDTAFGKGWQAWIRKHAELKAKGQKADIEIEPLD